MQRNIVMLGIQGSGKGTQADRIAERLGIPTISTGKLFRAEIDQKTDLGREISDYMGRGDRVPSELTNRVMGERLGEDDTVNGVIIDGYPRAVDEAEALDQTLAKLGRKVTHVIFIDVTDSVAMKRLEGRMVCSNPKCETNYHIEFNPPKKDPNRCDRCGSPLVKRHDDVPEAIKRRMELYHKDTKPLIDYYRTRGVLVDINGEQDIHEVEAEINGVLGI